MRPYLENPSLHIFLTHKNVSYDFPAHFHKSIEICFCFEGKQKIRLGNDEYILCKNDALVIFPGTVHEYIKCEDFENQSHSVSIISDSRLVSQSFPEIITMYPKSPLVKAKDISDDARLAFEKILETATDAKRVGWTQIILSDIIDKLCLDKTKSESGIPEKIIAYIDENFKEDLTIEHIARVFGYNASYVAHIFCDRLKVPFRTYLGAVRCEFAAEQIKSTKKSFSEIAFESGFNSLNTFCRCFKKHFSCTPSEYKKSKV